MNGQVSYQVAARAASLLCLLCAMSLPAHAFDAETARAKSAALTAAQMQRAWDLFEEGFKKAKDGNGRTAADLFRAGLNIHPAVLRVHAMLASLLEQQGQDRDALEHWQAVQELGAEEPDDQARAKASVQRINARIARIPLLHAASSTIRVSCDSENAGAEISINGVFKGECPIDISVTAGNIKLRAVRQVNSTMEQVHEEEIRLGTGVVKRQEIVLGRPQLNAQGRRAEQERVTKEQAEARRRQEERDRAEEQARRVTDEIRRKADSGDIAAMKELADLYMKGNQLPRDEAQALAWLIKAGEKGDAAAQVRTGRMYATGQGVAAHKHEAFRWFAMAAAQGDVTGLTHEAMAYRDGTGVAQDRARAVKTLREISEKGGSASAPAMALFALTLEQEQKYADAILWYQRAADASDPVGTAGLGAMHLNGWGTPRDPAKAEPLLRKAAKAGNGRGMTGLGVMYYHGIGVQKDTAHALTWFLSAMEAGDFRHAGALADILAEVNASPKDVARAQELLRRGEAAGDSNSMLSLGLMLERGLGGPQNGAAAFAMYAKAAALGDGQAMTNVGLYHKFGRGGLSVDRATATSWFRKAAALGVEQAVQLLKQD